MDELYEDQVVVPDSDEDKAKSALTAILAIGLGPSIDTRNKIAALRAVLEFTKSKPATKVDARVSNAEAWLASVIAENSK